jgi:ABC-type iron transport system FetAB ATPase subunit
MLFNRLNDNLFNGKDPMDFFEDDRRQQIHYLAQNGGAYGTIHENVIDDPLMNVTNYDPMRDPATMDLVEFSRPSHVYVSHFYLILFIN